jgi:ComF family protein
MKKSIRVFFDVILPRKCSGCNEVLHADEVSICNDCLQSIKPIDVDLVQKEFDKDFKDSKIISDLTSLFVFEKDSILQQVIHNIKYNKQFNSAVTLGKMFAEKHRELLEEWSIDLIIPIPLHHLKKAERGFNQSDFFAKGISKQSGIKLSTNAVKRIRYTESQTGFNRKKREENMENAFKVKKENLVDGKNILLVDDVITTGATIRECGKALFSSGADQIFAGSIAVTDPTFSQEQIPQESSNHF